MLKYFQQLHGAISIFREDPGRVWANVVKQLDIVSGYDVDVGFLGHRSDHFGRNGWGSWVAIVGWVSCDAGRISGYINGNEMGIHGFVVP